MTPDPHEVHPGLRWQLSGQLVPLSGLIGHDQCTCDIGHCATHPIRARHDEHEAAP